MIGFQAKQKQGLRLLKDNKKILYHYFGGSRSGKTHLDTCFFIIRAVNYPNTRQLFCRASKASCVTSIWMQTLIPILDKYCNHATWEEDKTKRIINFSSGSSIWAGGFDNRQHEDEILAKEWAGILVEEASELRYTQFTKLLTRLNWNPNESKIPLKMILECNPLTTSHWLNQYFHKFIEYETKEKLKPQEIKELSSLHFSPEDNKKNLSPIYLEKLRNSRGMHRKRFYEGIYADSFEGQIYDSFDRAVNVVSEPIKYNNRAELWRAWDFGISPSETFIIFMQLILLPKSKEFPEGYKIEIFHEYVSTNKDYKHYANYIKGLEYKHDTFRDAGDPAGESRNESLESWSSRLRSEGIHIEIPRGRPSIADYVSNANTIIPYIRTNEKQCPRILEMFENWSRPKDKDGQVQIGSKPEHDKHSHPGTAWYYFCGVRFPFKRGQVFLP